MTSVVYTIVLIVSFIFLVWKNDETESYFPLKIIGYFILGSFAFNFNQISLPLGFGVYLLFFRPKLNIHIKRKAAFFGFLAFILIHWTIPYAIDEWENRPTFIEHELGSIYTMNFQDEYKLVKQELKLKNKRMKLEDFEVDYTIDGKIEDLNWQLLGNNGSGYNYYQIEYDFVKNRYRVISSQIETWLQYNRLVDADHFFENLNILSIKEITQSKGEFSSYVIRSTGERSNYAVKNIPNFFVSNGNIHLLDDDQLPVGGYYISTFAMKKTGEKRDDQGNITQESFEGTESSNYLFDMNFGEE